MAENPKSSVYIGNLDDRVSDRILYDILIQAGRVVDLHIPRDKETNKPKGFAFAQYESEEIADYAVKLFSGLVTLYNRTLKFAISGQDRNSLNKTVPSLQYSSLPGSHSMQNEAALPAYLYRSHYDGNNNDLARKALGTTMDSINRSRLSRHDKSSPVSYPTY